MVIGDAPLVNYLPLKLSKDSRDESRRVVTQFDMHGVEKLGLLKMDFLGLRTLSVIEDTVSLLRRRGVELDVDHLPLDDERTYAMLQTGDTTGVFQLEGVGMRSLIKLLLPEPVRGPDGPGRAVPPRARSARTCTPSTRSASTAAARWSTRTPTSRRSSARPTG